MMQGCCTPPRPPGPERIYMYVYGHTDMARKSKHVAPGKQNSSEAIGAQAIDPQSGDPGDRLRRYCAPRVMPDCGRDV